MKIEGVTFVENAVKSMTKEEFIERHIKVLWQDRKEASRKKMLSDTYDKILWGRKLRKKIDNPAGRHCPALSLIYGKHI